MAVKNIYEETTWFGTFKIIEQTNGVKIRLCKSISEEYALQRESKLKKHADAMKKEELSLKLEHKIEKKKRELAIKELLESGEITQEELNKLEDQ